MNWIQTAWAICFGVCAIEEQLRSGCNKGVGWWTRVGWLPYHIFPQQTPHPPPPQRPSQKHTHTQPHLCIIPTILPIFLPISLFLLFSLHPSADANLFSLFSTFSYLLLRFKAAQSQERSAKKKTLRGKNFGKASATTTASACASRRNKKSSKVQ